MPNGGTNHISEWLQWNLHLLRKQRLNKNSLNANVVETSKLGVSTSLNQPTCCRFYFKYYLYFCALLNIMGRIIGIYYDLKKLGWVLKDQMHFFAPPLFVLGPGNLH